MRSVKRFGSISGTKKNKCTHCSEQIAIEQFERQATSLKLQDGLCGGVGNAERGYCAAKTVHQPQSSTWPQLLWASSGGGWWSWNNRGQASRSARSRRRHTYLSNPFARSVLVPRDKEISSIFYDVDYYLLFTNTMDMFLLVRCGLRPLPRANHAQCTQCPSCLL